MTIVSIAVNLAPLLVYFFIRPHVPSDTYALALAWLIPVAWTLGTSIVYRRLDPWAMLGVTGYGIALGVSSVFGAGALPLKLHHAIVAGALGIASLVSVAFDRPLVVYVARFRMRHMGYATQVDAALADPKLRRKLTRITLVVGVVATADAVVQTVLALRLSTAAFVLATPFIHIATVACMLAGVVLSLMKTT